MPDSIELKRKRAKAKAKLAMSSASSPSPEPDVVQPVAPGQTSNQIMMESAQSVGQAFSQPFETYGKGLSQFNPFGDNFNPIAGSLNMNLGTAQLAAAPLVTATEAFRQIPGIREGIDFVGGALGSAGEFVGGKVKELAGRASPVIGEQSAEPMGELANILTQVGLTAGTVKGASKIGKIVPKNVPRRLYKSALKPSTTNPAEGNRIVETALEQKAPINKRSIDRRALRADELESVVERDIAANAGQMVPVGDLIRGLDDLEVRMSKTLNSEKAIADIREVRNSILTNPNVVRNQIPLETVQELKKSIYRGNKYQEGVTPPVKSEGTVFAEKLIGHNAMEAINRRLPSVKVANQELSQLYTIEKPIASAYEKSQNQQVVPVSPFIVGSAAGFLTGGIEGGAMGGGIGGAVSAAKLLIDHPGFKSKTAIALERLRKSAK